MPYVHLSFLIGCAGGPTGCWMTFGREMDRLMTPLAKKMSGRGNARAGTSTLLQNLGQNQCRAANQPRRQAAAFSYLDDASRRADTSFRLPARCKSTSIIHSEEKVHSGARALDESKGPLHISHRDTGIPWKLTDTMGHQDTGTRNFRMRRDKPRQKWVSRATWVERSRA